MKIRLTLACLFIGFAAIVTAQSYHYESVAGDPLQARIYTLDNGLKVYLSVNKEKPRIQTYIAVRTGSRNDPAETSGLAHYLEHLMFKGTTHFGTSNLEKETPLLNEIERRFENYRLLTDSIERKKAYQAIDSVSQLAAQYNIPNEYDKMMSAIGSQGSNAYTSNDVTCYVENIPSNEVDNWLKVQGDRFQNMVIRGFHTELEAVYEEYNIGLSQDMNKMYYALMAKLFPNHPYGTQTTIGKGEHLKNPSITNIKNYFSKYYVPNNVAICMAGDLDPDKTIAAIDKYFGNWKKSESLSAPTYPALKPITAPEDTTVVGQEAESLFIAWRSPQAKELLSDSLNVIGLLLNNGKAGLMDLDLNQQMKVKSAGAGFEGLNDYSMFVLTGSPKQGQTLEEVKDLLLGEVEKLKRGDFSDDLLPSIINNYKRNQYEQLANNDDRANEFVDAFINHENWATYSKKLDRISNMTKHQLVDLAQKFFGNNYVCVYKRLGNDSTIKKVEKPHITPIPTNSDKHSAFLDEVVDNKPEPIQPVFVDFKNDLTQAKTKKGLPILYKQNTQDGLFTLRLKFPVGTENDCRYTYAAEYIDYLGTKHLSNQQLKQQFYKLACDYDFNAAEDEINITVNGLNENMPQALKLLTELVYTAKADKKTYSDYVDLCLKQREDNKKDQDYNFQALYSYGIYGPYNSVRNELSATQLKQQDPLQLLNLLKELPQTGGELLYYGPTSLSNLEKLIAKTPWNQACTPAHMNKQKVHRYEAQATPQNEILIAPYDAKNIYMMQYHDEGVKTTPERMGIISLFNEYFGTGGMGAIVFQELREARGLAYSAYASYNKAYRKYDHENFYTYIITQNDKMTDCINEFNTLLDSMPARQASFDLAKQSLTKKLEAARTTKFAILTRFELAKKMGLNCDPSQLTYEQIKPLKLSDLSNFANQYIAHKPYKYIILGDEKELDMNALEKIGTIKRVSTNEIFGY